MTTHDMSDVLKILDTVEIIATERLRIKGLIKNDGRVLYTFLSGEITNILLASILIQGSD